MILGWVKFILTKLHLLLNVCHCMKIAISILTLLFCFTFQKVKAQSIIAPDEFFGTNMFRFQAEIDVYLKYLADNSEYLRREEYGHSYEGRPLSVLYFSSKKNLNNLEIIALENRKRSGLESGEGKGEIPVLWLNFNIHGDEASGAEAAVELLYQLVTEKSSQIDSVKENLLLIIDPCANPDGRDRYVQNFKQRSGVTIDPKIESWEHHQPWPGGRFNHYLFDLNRDWIWQTQQETQQRVMHYRFFMPQVHVDFHEMSYQQTYFMGWAAKPVHDQVTSWQKDFQKNTALSIAGKFDENHWLYYHQEIFDFWYPGYGDTWPTFQGAVGFTMEQAGGGYAGLAVKKDRYDTLRIEDRIAHHVTAARSVILSSLRNSKRLLVEYDHFFLSGKEKPEGDYHAYVIRAKNNAQKISAIQKLLKSNQVEYRFASEQQVKSGYDFFTRKWVKSVTVEKGDLVVQTTQPLGRLVQVLFAPNAIPEDSLTYDLTAWAIPYLFNVQSYAFESSDEVRSVKELTMTKDSIDSITKTPFAYVIPWEGFQSAKLLGKLLTTDFTVRYAQKPFSLQDKDYPAGTLLLYTYDNQRFDHWESSLKSLAKSYDVPLVLTYSGATTKGADLGSLSFPILSAPNIALIQSEECSATGLGEYWHFFDQQLAYPVTVIPVHKISSSILSGYDVVILPDGTYHRHSWWEPVKEYVERGGTVIGVKGALDLMSIWNSSELYSFKPKLGSYKKGNYANQERLELSNQLAGPICKVKVDNSHPLGYGLSKNFFWPKTSNEVFQPLAGQGWNVGVYESDPVIMGIAGQNIQKLIPNTLAFGVQKAGDGQMIYFTESPVLRGFWYSGFQLFANAIFFRE